MAEKLSRKLSNLIHQMLVKIPNELGNGYQTMRRGRCLSSRRKGFSLCCPGSRNGVSIRNDRVGLFVFRFDKNGMGHVDVVATRPKFPFTEELDGEILTIFFIDGSIMSYDTKFTFELSGADLAGNLLVGEYDLEKCEYKSREYSFTTMSKKE